MFKGKILVDFTNLFSPNNFGNNDNVILNFFWIKTDIRTVETNKNVYP